MKKRFALWMAFLLLAGCSSAPVEHTPKGENGVTDDEIISGEETDSQDGENLNLTYSEMCLPVYQARIRDWPSDQDEIEKGFFGDAAYEQAGDLEGQFFHERRFLSYYCDNGSMMSLDGGAMTFYTPHVEKFHLSYFYGDIITESNKYLFANMYQQFPEGMETVFQETDLWFMSSEEARELAEKYLDLLNVEYGDEWICYAVSSDRITEVQKKMYPDEQWEYTKEDDNYFFEIPLAVNGWMLNTGGVKVDNAITLQGSYARAMVGPSGLWFLDVWMPFETVGESEARPVITGESAMQCAEEWYSQLLGAGKIELENLGIRYVAQCNTVRDAEAFELIPTWMIKATFQDGTRSLLPVDAYTGERR